MPEEIPAVVEPNPISDVPDLSMHAMQKRIRQQEILAELGVTALQGATFEQLLTDTARLTADGLEAEFCKVLEYIPSQNRLLVRAGVGWNQGIVGVATIGADLESPAGFALQTGKPVISNHLENEERFRTPDILRQHGIYRAMNVILQGDEKPFGVLEVDSRSDNKFEQRDLAFLQGAANILGMAIERERYERRLKAALDRHQILLKEMNHRVKNSLQMVSSMLNLQSRNVSNEELKEHLNQASYRVAAIAKAHEQLSHSSHIERMDVGQYVKTVCGDLDKTVAHCEVYTDCEEGIKIETDRAISVALIVNELITNSAKYAYGNRSGGEVWVKVSLADKQQFAISVRDEGAGLPVDFDPQKAKGLGMRIVSAFVSQLGAKLGVHALTPGTEFVLTIPLMAPP